MKNSNKAIAALTAAALMLGAATMPSAPAETVAYAATPSIESQVEVGTLGIGGGGFVSGIIAGDDQMYARTDVGGVYRYDFEAEKWIQLMDFITDKDKGFLSVDGLALDPTDDDIIYMLAGCAYFSDARTSIFRSKDAGETWDEIDVTDMIQVHGNGYGRHMGESIAVDPDNPNIIYCGGDVTAGESALIMSEDGGDTWVPVKGYDDLGYYSSSMKWPTWTEHMVRALSDAEYVNQNGVSLVHIQDGKVYVGTTMTAEGNLVVADVGSDDFEVLSADLPTDVMPARISVDAEGRMLICYVANHQFGNGAGGVYRYDPKTGTVENISPVNNSIGACQSAPDNADELIATTCAVWSTQNWDKDTTAWGEWLYRSTDGGKTWDSIYPGKMGQWIWNPDTGEMMQEQLYGYPSTGGSDWIWGKAVHWSGTLVLDPFDPTKIWVSSGNGVFEWQQIWTEDPQLVFHADGIEEVVCLDMVSIPGGDPVSVIGDYDGFIHHSKTESTQLTPSMNELTDSTASTAGIAYCPSNPDVMVRLAEGFNRGFYTTDGGKTWTVLENIPIAKAKAAINQLEDGSYRILVTAEGKVSYTDDFGKTWQNSSLEVGMTSPLWMQVDPSNPQYVYGYGYYYNQYYFYSKPTATIDDARYVLMVSDDYGATFKNAQTICQYDECDGAYRIAYLGEGEFVLGAGWYGAYHVSDYGKTVTKLESVNYCKTIGYGAPEKDGGKNTLYMWGKPLADDPEGVYMSTDCGETWKAFNITRPYGGTANGNFLVGDMNTFGTVYMSTAGCGIVYMSLSEGANPDKPDDTTTTTTTTTTTANTTTSTTAKTTSTSGKTTTTTTTTATTTTSKIDVPADVYFGDTNLDQKISMVDLVLLNKYNAALVQFNDQQLLNADCSYNGTIDSADARALLQYTLEKIDSLPVMP